MKESVCEVRTQDPENFDEEVLALVSAWCLLPYAQGTSGPAHAYNRCPITAHGDRLGDCVTLTEGE